MFTAALFTTAKIWKQSKCPRIEEDVIHTHIQWNIIAIKKNEILPFVTIRMELLEAVLLSKINQTEKMDTICGI